LVTGRVRKIVMFRKSLLNMIFDTVHIYVNSFLGGRKYNRNDSFKFVILL